MTATAREMFCVGLIGGLGIGATLFYYERLAEIHATRGVPLNLVMANAEVSQIFAYAQADDHGGMARYLNDYIVRLQAAGASAVAIPAVIPHLCLDELNAVSSLPVLDILQALSHALVNGTPKRIALFGTKSVIASDLFGRLPASVEIVRPRSDEVEAIHQTYRELVEQRRGTEAHHARLVEIAKRLVEQEGCEAIVLAGTDFAVLFRERKPAFPVIDLAELHIRWIADKLLEANISS